MAVRTYKLYGVAFAEGKPASLTIQFDGRTVFTGTVPTQNSASPKFLTSNSDESVIAQWTSTTDVTGTVPVAISASSGDFIWTQIHANYSGIRISYDPPADPANPVPVIETQPIDFYRDVNVNDSNSDGRTDVAIDGVALNEGNGLRPANITDGSLMGDWYYKVPEGSVLTCNLYVDPDIIIVQ
jgi:hypothetical protein